MADARTRLIAELRQQVVDELIRRASEGCEGPLDENCGKTQLPMSKWCDPCRCQVAAAQIQLAADALAAEDAAATIAKLREIVKKWSVRADHGFDPEETDEQFEFWRGVRNVCADIQIALPAPPDGSQP